METTRKGLRKSESSVDLDLVHVPDDNNPVMPNGTAIFINKNESMKTQ